MRAALTLLLALHGAIHLFGFLKWSRLAAVPQLSGRTLIALSPFGERLFAALWLLAALALLGAAALRLSEGGQWWTPALTGILLSQGLIVFAWRDARFGTVANMLLLLPTLAAVAAARFARQTDAEIEAVLAAAAPARATLVERAELDRLPPPVRRWLEAAGVVGRPRSQLIHLQQRGELRTSPDGLWMPARAEQYFSVEPPAFVWTVDTSMMGVVPVAGRDKLAAGHGHMLIKAASLLAVVDAADAKIDHGSMLRFLGEMVWFPSAALAPYLTWQAIDDRHAAATLRHDGLTVSAVFHFDEQGRVVGLRAERYLGGGDSAKLTPWVVTCTSWRTFDGVTVPDRGTVGWELAGGEFTYYRWQILEVDYNRRARRP